MVVDCSRVKGGEMNEDEGFQQELEQQLFEAEISKLIEDCNDAVEAMIEERGSLDWWVMQDQDDDYIAEQEKRDD